MRRRGGCPGRSKAGAARRLLLRVSSKWKLSYYCVGAGIFAGLTLVEQKPGCGGDAEICAGQLGDGLADGGKVLHAFDSGQGEVWRVVSLFWFETESFAAGVEIFCQREEWFGSAYATEEDAGLVWVGIPAEAADGCCDWAVLWDCGEGGLEFFEALFWPRADEFRRNVKVVGRAPV